ncbi:esterase [Escherichia coli]|uniref:Esterase n=1 Tax=Escherichia coli TaxID=562 RepID=A0A376YA14_ECOLX|nr:esterase [Escherichia coli]
MIWKRKITLEALNAMGEGNMVGFLDIRLNILVMTPLKRQCQ